MWLGHTMSCCVVKRDNVIIILISCSDYVYNGYYINSVDSSNYNTARGFNYHQGPVSGIAIHFQVIVSTFTSFRV